MEFLSFSEILNKAAKSEDWGECLKQLYKDIHDALEKNYEIEDEYLTEELIQEAQQLLTMKTDVAILLANHYVLNK